MSRRLLTLALAAGFLALVPPVPAPAACADVDPPNDCIVNATPITTRSPGHLRVSNVNAGVEPGEPGVGPDMQFTVWWKFTAWRTSSGSFSVHDSDHQAGVAVYELQPDSSFRLLDRESGWSSWHWATFDCVAGRTYYIQAGGEEGQSGTIDLWGDTCQLGPEKPSAPTLTAVPGGPRGTVQLSYHVSNDGGAAVVDREIQRSERTCSDWAEIRPNDPTDTPLDSTGLAEGTMYCYRVRVQNSVGWSPWSNLDASEPKGLPLPPWSIAATGISSSTISLAWNPSSATGGSPVTHFSVYGSDAAAGPFVLLGTPSGTTFAEGGLQPGTTRHYRVAAVNGFGEGPAATASGRTPAPPGVPRDVAAGPAFPFGVRVSWNAPADDGGSAITQYVVLRGEKDGPLTERARLPGSARSFTESPGLLRPFDYAVYAVNAQGTSPVSPRVCGEAFPSPPPFERC